MLVEICSSSQVKLFHLTLDMPCGKGFRNQEMNNSLIFQAALIATVFIHHCYFPSTVNPWNVECGGVGNFNGVERHMGIILLSHFGNAQAWHLVYFLWCYLNVSACSWMMFRSYFTHKVRLLDFQGVSKWRWSLCDYPKNIHHCVPI